MGSSTESAPVSLARRAVETYIQTGRSAVIPDDMPGELREERAGVFVCIKKRGELRGCIGTTQPTQESVAGEIIRNAMECATRDPRFPPVTEDELADLKYTVDVLGAPEQVAGEGDLDPKRYGVIVRSGGRTGLLLPDLAGVDTVAQQLDIARRKAGIAGSEAVTLYRFTVTRYE